jgi:putative ATP-dependent endonuclease of OLD family
MYLEKFKIQNFRGIDDLTLTFNEGLNIIIGENNSGKTRIIDALRLCLGYKDIDRTIYINEKDFTIGMPETESIGFSLYFNANHDEQELFYDIFNPETEYLEIHFKYYIKVKNNRKRIYNKVWGGSFEGQQVPDEIFHELYHIYLDPLRDSRRYLHPGRNNILGKFFTKVETEYDKNELIQDLNEQINGHKIMNFIESSKEGHIDSHLDGMTHSNFPAFDINLIPEEYDNFVNNFFITLPIDGGNLELSQNGLGYNNLIYMSILLGNLRDSNDDEQSYTALCVEEPEAHLHPQLQKSFFNYLIEFLNDVYPFQIFMTSHSPILVSHANLDSLIILENINNEITDVNWTNLNLDEKNKKYLTKFFDSMKANILFSKKVILVEGPSEKILMPFFAKIKNLPFEKENIELVETGGNSNLLHYAKLFLEDEEKEHLKKKCAILVDNDRNSLQDICSDTSLKLMNEYDGNNIKVFTSEKDFEFEIINANKENINLLEYLLLDNTIVSNIQFTRNFLNELNEEQYDENLIYDYINNIKFKKTNLPLKIIHEWENLDNFKIPVVVDDLFEFLKED